MKYDGRKPEPPYETEEDAAELRRQRNAALDRMKDIAERMRTIASYGSTPAFEVTMLTGYAAELEAPL